MNFNKTRLFILFVVFSTIGCKDDDEMVFQDNPTLFSEMQQALGGADNIANATAITYQAIGVALEPQEDPEPVNGKVADYTYNLTYNLDGTQSKQEWDVDAEYAYATHFEFVETIDGTRGLSEGSTGTFPERFAGFGVTGDPMFSTKLAARQMMFEVQNTEQFLSVSILLLWVLVTPLLT